MDVKRVYDKYVWNYNAFATSNIRYAWYPFITSRSIDDDGNAKLNYSIGRMLEYVRQELFSIVLFDVLFNIYLYITLSPTVNYCLVLF